jgi:DNA-binding response OmpR family regulator
MSMGTKSRLAVLDINMPRMGGRDTINRLRERGATFPILVASGFTDTLSREKMGGVKVDGYIQKPFRLEEFKEKINALIDFPVP